MSENLKIYVRVEQPIAGLARQVYKKKRFSKQAKPDERETSFASGIDGRESGFAPDRKNGVLVLHLHNIQSAFTRASEQTGVVTGRYFRRASERPCNRNFNRPVILTEKIRITVTSKNSIIPGL